MCKRFCALDLNFIDPNNNSMRFHIFECLCGAILSVFTQNIHNNLPSGQECQKVDDE